MNTEEKSDRYQCQPWYIKLWRKRYYWYMPFGTLRAMFIYLTNKEFREDEKEWGNTNVFRYAAMHWKIEKGLAQVKMKWYYTWDEVKERLNFNDDDLSDPTNSDSLDS